MRKRIKIIPVAVLLSLILLLTLLAVPVSAAGGRTFQFTCYPQENISLTLAGGTLIVENLPDTAAFRSIYISVVNVNGRKQIEAQATRREDGSASLPLGNPEDGDYFLELYFSIGNDEYASYIFGHDLRFRRENGAYYFVDPPTLDHNRKIFESGRADSGVLAFYLTPSFGVQSDHAAIIDLAHDITEDFAKNYDKALAIHDWVCANLWYDTDSVTKGSRLAGDAVSTLIERRAVCEGYANLTAALLRAVNIPAKVVQGYGLLPDEPGGWTSYKISTAEANHVWNEAYIDGRWVIIETTWDSGNEYENNKKVYSDGVYSHRYFDSTIEAFSADHRLDDYGEKDIPFADAPSMWAMEQVENAISAGLVPQNLRINYSQTATRAEYCLLAVVLYEKYTGVEITKRKIFGDTIDVNVEKAAAVGIASGVGDNRFAPNDKLTREQAAVMLSRLAESIGKPLNGQTVNYADINSISAWAAESVGQAQATGIMSGVGNNIFAPKDPYTREQSIITMIRLYNWIGSL